MPDEMRYYADKVLPIIAEQISKDEVRTVTVRELLSWFGVVRRTASIVSIIENRLAGYGLTTSPSFASVWLGSEVQIVAVSNADRANEYQKTENSESSADHLNNSLSKNEEVVFKDPAYRVSRLEAANRKPICVAANDSLEKAVTLMLVNDYSQLPVTNGDRNLKGIISWRSIGRTAYKTSLPGTVKECMEDAFSARLDDYIFSVVDLVLEHDVVIVKDDTNLITGIITAADLGMLFNQLSEPYILIGEIENHIRNILEEKIQIEEIIKVVSAGNVKREIKSVTDLTFGDYVRTLENPKLWDQVGSKFDRGVVVELLDEVRRVRNCVMHFDPDGPSPEDIELLRRTALFLQSVYPN